MLKMSFNGTSRNDEHDTIQALTDITTVVKDWMDLNRLKMNDTETEYIFFGSRQQLCKIDTTNINVNDAIILASPCIRYLCADLDSQLSLKTMITCKCRVAMGNLQKLKQIRNCLTPEATATLAIGLVTSHLDYANAIYFGLPKSELGKPQRIQNMVAKLITKARKYDSSTEALKSLHWLPIHLRIEFKVLTLVFRVIHGLAPAYLADLFTINTARRSGLRSSSTACTLVVPFTKKKMTMPSAPVDPKHGMPYRTIFAFSLIMSSSSPDLKPICLKEFNTTHF